MTASDLNDLFTQTSTRPIDFINFCLSHGVTISESTVSQQRSGKIGIGLFAQVAYGCFFSQYQNKSKMENTFVASAGAPFKAESDPNCEAGIFEIVDGKPILIREMNPDYLAEWPNSASTLLEDGQFFANRIVGFQ